MELSRLIRYQLYAEIMLVVELRMRYLTILRYSDYLDTQLRKIWYEPCEVLSLECTTRCVILWVEIEESEWGGCDEGSERYTE